ncbi:MAG: hypothetical protein DI637_12080 [Citromicrobium sp.]|nr:MAG: hypothetical protein DI637_12080 [Citromicrobium sp.]
MDEESEIRRNWRLRWLSSIAEFADLRTQEKMWLDRNNTNPHWSFVEYMCSYFDDLFLSDLHAERVVRDAWLTQDEFEAIAEFHALADAYNSPTDDYDHSSILADRKWRAVVEAAKIAQSNLLAILVDDVERNAVSHVHLKAINERWQH